MAGAWWAGHNGPSSTVPIRTDVRAQTALAPIPSTRIRPVRIPSVGTILTALLLLASPAAAQPALPPGYVEEPDVPPEDPLPSPPAELPLAPIGPVVTAPDARDLLRECKEASFTDCFRLWQPPAPPPEPEKKEAKATPPPPPPPPDPNAPRQPAQGGPLSGPPPAPKPEADRATYEALVKALKESGLEGKIVMPPPPKDGGTVLQVDPRTHNRMPQPRTPPPSPTSTTAGPKK